MRTVALVVAAGRGTRYGGEAPKQYAPLLGRPVLRHALEALLAHNAVEAVRAVIHEDDRQAYEGAVEGLALLPPVEGGASRQDSVRLGLESLAELAPDAVAIHDAARPFLPADVIDRLLQAIETGPAAIAALPLADTLKRADGEAAVVETVPREGLWRAQTPQAFRYQAILAAHRQAQNAGLDFTDDAAVAENAGLPVRLVTGAAELMKITTPDDLHRAERWLAGGQESRVGQGFDVHRFGPGSHVMLCGVRIGHDRGLVGHSDADAGLHAITDALLGAMGAGDIGQHFPPSDPKWRNAESAVFLTHAAALLRSRGGAIQHLDATLICEAPKIGPHRETMAARVAEIAGITRERVSIKATTTEGLGFTGRGEGIAAIANATVLLPRGA
ncbi:MAG: bifunctional 2-C-methyl-D-erythritol 4-phosphate cytidylyltransferase/2-C-methyl-D-erythritol 2,4-cyclodiphosphate synthase [Rhodovibrionaceae bacterium]|nr:bifunctional 2-C-methyl-D-erythritol 4-phosphate cytidylyltransferase/2-C-methyl-D-erythritol 2,4-cyclodiphosphate synthase [Rhodovibrionaceae bacterium]